jgi:hypothetical protein
MREICAREYGGETVAGEGGAGHGWTGKGLPTMTRVVPGSRRCRRGSSSRE